jgi:hypothetical protein
MKKHIIPFLFAINTTILMGQPALTWAKKIGGDLSIDNGSNIGLHDGNIYLNGTFSGEVDLDPGLGECVYEALSWYSDVFIEKLDASGTFLWGKRIGGNGYAGNCQMTVDKNGNVYSACLYTDTVDLDPGPGVYKVGEMGNADIFICKMDPSGNFVWGKSFGSSAQDMPTGIDVDMDGNVYFTGNFRNTIDMDPGSGTHILTALAFEDVFVCKLNSAGAFIWAVQLAGSFFERSSALAIDNNSNVYIAGTCSDSVDFDPGPGVYQFSSPDNSTFYWKLNTDGELVWAKEVGNGIWIKSILTDSANNVYLTGGLQSVSDLDPGPSVQLMSPTGINDLFIQKLDASGNLIWTKTTGCVVKTTIPNSSALHSDENLFVAAMFDGVLDLDFGLGIAEHTSAGNYDGCIVELSSDGEYICSTSFGSDNYERIGDIAVDANGNLHTVGFLQDTVDFDPGPGTQFLYAHTADVFVNKYEPCTPIGLAEFAGQTEIEIFPNPSSGIFNLNYNVTSFKNARIIVYDLVGKKIYAHNPKDDFNRIDLSDQPSGFYFLELNIDGKNTVKKMIIN